MLGFWSYVHADDNVDMGRVVQLGRDIVANYEAITAESVELFLDLDYLHWGDTWRDRIDEALSNVAFFVPVLTPRYFKSPECRRELQFFVGRAGALGIDELILPILYIEVPELNEDEPSDPLVKMVKSIQWRSWTAFRFADRSAGEYRQAVHDLAQELDHRIRTVEKVDVAAVMAERAEAAADSEAGTLDKIAALEVAMPRWSKTLEAITAQMEGIGLIMDQATSDLGRGDRQGKGAAARLVVARRVAQELETPVSEIEHLGQQFAVDLAEIDSGVRTLLEEGALQVTQAGGVDNVSLDEYCDFVGSIRLLADATKEGLGSVEGMISAVQNLERMSKDMRSPVRRLRASLTAMMEARETTAGWVELADQLGVSCPPGPQVMLDPQ